MCILYLFYSPYSMDGSSGFISFDINKLALSFTTFYFFCIAVRFSSQYVLNLNYHYVCNVIHCTQLSYFFLQSVPVHNKPTINTLSLSISRFTLTKSSSSLLAIIGAPRASRGSHQHKLHQECTMNPCSIASYEGG